jgi:hypothetical protein
MEKYTPELLLGMMVMVKNIVLIAACAWTTVTLYKLSGSWHCLWALLMLLAMGSYKFVRD